MAFEYYKRLSSARQSIYRQSDAILTVPLPDPQPLLYPAQKLAGALVAEDRAKVQTLSQTIASGIVEQMQVPALKVQVLAARPSNDWGELHGLYLPEDGGTAAKVQLWMRTARHKRVVAYKSYLRTLLHEICHHLDYEFYKFPETFHTEGFYHREASLFHQLVPTHAPPASAGE